MCSLTISPSCSTSPSPPSTLSGGRYARHVVGRRTRHDKVGAQLRRIVDDARFGRDNASAGGDNATRSSTRRRIAALWFALVRRRRPNVCLSFVFFDLVVSCANQVPLLASHCAASSQCSIVAWPLPTRRRACLVRALTRQVVVRFVLNVAISSSVRDVAARKCRSDAPLALVRRLLSHRCSDLIVRCTGVSGGRRAIRQVLPRHSSTSWYEFARRCRFDANLKCPLLLSFAIMHRRCSS